MDKKQRKVEVIHYNKEWLVYYQQEAEKIVSLLRNLLTGIFHIGSTSIPNMPAKPVIDILLECDDLDAIEQIKDKLRTLQYFEVSRHVVPHRSFFTRKQVDGLGYHLLIRERGDPQIRRHVNFKEYLIAHPEVATEYAYLKKRLAVEFKDDMYSYVMGKDKLVQEIDAKAKIWANKKFKFSPANKGPLAKNWSETKIVKAMEANMNVHMTHFAQYLSEVSLIRVPGYTVVNSGLPDDTFNYVLEADFTTLNAEEKIREVTAKFSDVPFSWWLSPNDKPEDLEKRLQQQGYCNTENNKGMFLDLDTWEAQDETPAGLKIIQAKDAKTLQDFALVLANDRESFKKYYAWLAAVITDEDPIEYYVGYIKDKPVVRGLTCYFAQVAGLYWLSTAPDERKKGYGSAMQQFRLKRAKALGYHVAVLQSSEEGYRLYERLGYKDCAVFKEYKFV